MREAHGQAPLKRKASKRGSATTTAKKRTCAKPGRKKTAKRAATKRARKADAPSKDQSSASHSKVTAPKFCGASEVPDGQSKLSEKTTKSSKTASAMAELGDAVDDQFENDPERIAGATCTHIPKWSSRVDQPVGKFRQKRVNRLLRLMRKKCLFQYEAAPVVGVGVKTVQRWLNRGRNHQETIDAWNARSEELEENGETLAEVVSEIGLRPQPNQWSRFAVAYERAEIVAKGRIMHVARTGALFDPKLAFEWLRRRYPDFSDKPQQVTHATDDDSAEDTSLTELEAAISTFKERAGATADPSKDGPEGSPKTPA